MVMSNFRRGTNAVSLQANMHAIVGLGRRAEIRCYRGGQSCIEKTLKFDNEETVKLPRINPEVI